MKRIRKIFGFSRPKDRRDKGKAKDTSEPDADADGAAASGASPSNASASTAPVVAQIADATAVKPLPAAARASVWAQRGTSNIDCTAFIAQGPWTEMWCGIDDGAKAFLLGAGETVTHAAPLASLWVDATVPPSRGLGLLWLISQVNDGQPNDVLLGFGTRKDRHALLARLVACGATPTLPVPAAAELEPTAEQRAALARESAEVRLMPAHSEAGEHPVVKLRHIEALFAKDVCLKAAAANGLTVRLSRLEANLDVKATLWVVLNQPPAGYVATPASLLPAGTKLDALDFEMNASFGLPDAEELVPGTWNVTLSIDGGNVFEAVGLRYMILRNDVVAAVNLGGPEYISTDGVRYAEGCNEEKYNNRRVATVRNAGIPWQAILKTDDGFLYSTCLNTSYDDLDGTDFEGTAPPGQYVCTLKFAQIMHPVVGGYLMRLLVQDNVVADILDVMAKAGYQTAYDLEVPMTVGADGKWKIRMAGLGGKCVPAPGAEGGMSFMNAFVIAKRGASSRTSTYPAPDSDELKFEIPIVRTVDIDEYDPKETMLSKNLLVNPSGEKELDGWTVDADGGDGFMRSSGGMESTFSLSTSFEWDLRSQEIDLAAAGFSERTMDNSKPAIHCGTYYRGDNGVVRWRVELRGEDHVALETHEVESVTVEDTGGKWVKLSHEFTQYSAGVRYVYFQDGGKDGRFWKGHYGPSLSGSYVRVARRILDAPAFASTTLEGAVSELIAFKRNDAPSTADEKSDGGLAKLLLSEPVVKTTTRPEQVDVSNELATECRVFVSSTFHDFFEERELLVKKVFPQLAALCVSRGVNFIGVDLRTGVTSEESADGRVLEICLREIDRCQPYFVAMLGERYGWHQRAGQPVDELLKKTFDRAIESDPAYAWLDKHRQSSATEVEIRAALLNNPERARKARAFAYLRDVVYLQTLEPAKRKGYEAENAASAARVKALRDEIRKSQLCPVRDYVKPAELATMLFEDMSKMIKTQFAPITAANQLQRERQAHNAFANSRAKNYVGGDAYYAALNEHLRAVDTLPLVVRGMSGGGKSALLANWARQVRNKNAEHDLSLIFTHFIGATSESSDHIALVRRLIGEIKQTFNIAHDIPADDNKCLMELPAWLLAGAARGRILIILDALNQLEDFRAALSLAWLPDDYPSNLRVVLSTLDTSRTWEVLSKRQTKQVVVMPLSREDKSKMIDSFMVSQSKSLSAEDKQQLMGAPQCDNPLHLITMLKEIVLFGVYERLDAYIDTLLKAPGVAELFDLVLERLERDYDVEPVSQLMASIWGSRNGLTEAELIGVTGLVRYDFSPLFFALQDHLVCRGGLYTFFHDYLRQAVVARYLGSGTPKDPAVVKLRRKLVAFFSETFSPIAAAAEGSGEVVPASARLASEVPYQLFCLDDKAELEKALLNPSMFVTMADTPAGRYDMLRYWNHVGDRSKAIAGYKAALDRLSELRTPQAQFTPLIQKVSAFLQDLGQFAASQMICLSFPIVNSVRDDGSSYGFKVSDLGNTGINVLHEKLSGPDRIAFLRVLLDLGAASRQSNQFGEALGYYKQALGLQPFALSVEDKQALAASLVGLGTVFAKQREFATARYVFEGALTTLIDVFGESHLLVQACLTNLASLYTELGLLEKAWQAHMASVKLVRAQVGVNHPLMAIALANVALQLKEEGEVRKAEALNSYAIQILVDIYGEIHPHVGTVRKNMANVKYMLGYWQPAAKEAQHAADILTETLGPDHPDTKLAVDFAAKSTPDA
eukprot:Unigene6205_Nuclearia_a/m.19105 Unigene6205_Nuclearia_a/g.19105  ORF Unigene6205_Nuclearia_a/g.19105 Unigene6205_Nuclearia_a/m.19105 type:complete len:1750 (-) Unigene6205_Nuclearia_a:111-5360(-)